MQGLCSSVAKPFARDTFVPGHFTGSAFILSPDERALLLILHGKLHRWLQPGGHVDAGDHSVLSAARREVREEVGIDDLALLSSVPIDLDIHDIPQRKDEPTHAHFDVRYLFRAPSFEFTAASDAKAARWVPLDEIDAELADGSVARVVAKLRDRS